LNQPRHEAWTGLEQAALIHIKVARARQSQLDRTPAGALVSQVGSAGVRTLEVDDDGLAADAIDAALKQTPRGAFALAGITVGLLIVAWLAVYFLVFLPRGSVG
jgi:hypothetical protein